MKHRLQHLLTLAFAGITLAGEPIGKLGTIELTADDFRDSILSLNEAQIASLRADPALLEQIARTSLVQKLVLQEATEKKWQEQPQIAARIRRAHDSAITESYLESIAEPARDFPSEDEVKAAYQAARESLKVPRSFRLSQVFIADDKAKLAKVEDLLSAKDADFAKIATEHSQEPTSASRGGEIGWLAETQIDKDLLPPIAELKLNGVSKPVKLKDGWHILKLLDARAAHTPTLEQARSQLVKQLRQDKLRANSQAYLADLLRKHPLQINASALTEALPSTPSANARP
jgi:parvulin-like peptidyl-prolyl isomerase